MRRSAWLGVALLAMGCGSGPAAPTRPSPPAASVERVSLLGAPAAPAAPSGALAPSLWPGFVPASAEALFAARTMSRRAVSALAAAVSAPPGTPQLSLPEVAGTTVTLRWTASPLGGAPSSYVIEYGTAPGTPIGSLDTRSTSTGYVATGVGAGTYYVRVRAVNDGGLSAPSNEESLRVGSSCSGRPGAPVLTSQVTGADVFLAWTRATSEDTYALEVNGAILMQTPQATLTNTNTPAGTYVVRVRTTNACGTSDFSNAVTLNIGGPPELPPMSCSSEGTLRSIDGNTTATIQFVNTSTQARQIFWLNYQGARVLYSTLNPGQSVNQPTYLTHPWLVATSGGSCLGIYMPSSTPSRVTLTDQSPTPSPSPGPTPNPAPSPAPGTFSITPTSRDFGTNGGCNGGTLMLPITVTAANNITWTVRASGSDFPGDSYHRATLSSTTGMGSGTVTLTITLPRQNPPSWSSCTNTVNYTFQDTITFDSSNGLSLSVSVRHTFVSVIGA